METTLGERLRRAREEQGFTVDGLGAMVGATESAVRQIELGTVKWPSLALGLRLAKALDIEPYAFAFGDRPSTTDRLDDHERRLRAVEKRLAQDARQRRG